MFARHHEEKEDMRAETQAVVDAVAGSLERLRRHL